MSKNPLPPADFTPDMGDYKALRPFRYWCQKVLPLVYDDSLSYYELLCKVVDFLNKTMEDVGTLHGDVEAIRNAYDQLQGYVNTYFDNLDVQEEINEKLDQMTASGTLAPYFAPYVNQYVTEWLSSHVTPTSPVLDKTLTINGAAAEAHYTGHRMQKNAFLAMLGEPHDYATINRNLVIPGYRVQGVTYNNGVFYVCGGSLAENGTGFIATMTDLKFKDFQLTEIPRLGHANDITYSAMDGYLYVCSVREGDAPVNGIWKINPNDFSDMTLIDNAPENTVGIQYRWGDYWILAPYRIYATTDFQTYEVIVENTNDMLTQYDVPTTGRLSQSLIRTPDHIIGWVASFVYNGKHYGAITYFSATGVPIAFDMFDTFGAEMECACYASMSLWGICDGSMVTVLRADVLHDAFVQLKAGDDLDDFTGRGVIYSTGANVSGQVLHPPVANEGFTLTVERQGLYNTRQDARTNSGRALYRTKSFNTGTWGDWVEPHAVLGGMIGDVRDDLAQVEEDLGNRIDRVSDLLDGIANFVDYDRDIVVSVPVTAELGYMGRYGDINTSSEDLSYTNRISVSEGDVLRVLARTAGKSSDLRIVTAFASGVVVPNKGVLTSQYYVVPEGIDEVVLSCYNGTYNNPASFPYVFKFTKGNLTRANDGNGFVVKSDTLGDAESIFLPLNNIRKNAILSFDATVTSFSALRIGRTGYLDVIRVTNSDVTVLNAGGSVVSTASHGLTITNTVSVRIERTELNSIAIIVSSNGVSASPITITWYKNSVGDPYVKSEGSTLADCTLSYAPMDINKKTWVFGGTDCDIQPNRWMGQLYNAGFLDNILLNSYVGNSAAQNVPSLLNLVDKGDVRCIVWANGENDGADTETLVSTTWLSAVNVFVTTCQSRGIIPVLATIPSTPTVNNELKNEWIRASGYRFIDFAKAVGAGADGVWYDGMMNNSSPTSQAGTALFNRAIVDCPELLED